MKKKKINAEPDPQSESSIQIELRSF
jgi:hypothetical protein